jgi:DNA end-binding protein Ku
MPRAVWTGTLSFGLVSIPVALYPATQPKDVRFHLFDREGRRVRYRRFAEEASPATTPPDRSGSREDAVRRPAAGDRTTATDDLDGEGAGGQARGGQRDAADRELGYEEVVRGYEVEPGRFAMLEHDEIDRIRPNRSATIELEDFVDLDAIDPVYFEKSYYLAPRREAERPYRLLQRALSGTRRAGIGRFVLRTKPHLVAVRPSGDVLGLETLFFGDEVRSSAELVRPGADEVSERELRLAEQLVEMLATSWDPDRYADEYRQELLRIISEKAPVETEWTTVEVAAGRTSRAEELMEALKRSVEEARAAQGSDRPASRRRTG